MNPLLEVNPAACLFVIGPQLSHKVAHNSTRPRSPTESAQLDSKPELISRFQNGPSNPPASYNSILDFGLSILNTKLPDGVSSNELSQIKKIALEEGAPKAMEKIVLMMNKRNCYDEWLKRTLASVAEQHPLLVNEKFTEKLRVSTENSAGSQVATVTTQTEIGSFQHLLSLQKRGALLACTQYDTILDSIAGTLPLTLHDTETLKQWSKLSTLPEAVPLQEGVQRKQLHNHPVGILHLHGVFTDPSSVRFTDYQKCKDKEEETSSERSAADMTTSVSARRRKLIPGSSHAEDFRSISPGMDILREIFRKRLVIFVGYDGEYFDPLLPGLLQVLYPDNESGSLKNPPILLTSMPLTRQLSIGKQLPSTFLTLMVSEEELHSLSTVISPGSPKNFTVGKGLTDKQSLDGLKVQAFLLFNEKQSFRKLGDIIYQHSKSGEIYVRRDALTVIFDDNKILYGNLVTYGGNGLRQLWKLVFSKGSTLLGKGLMALGLQNAAIIWTNRKPAELGNVTGINSVHTYAAHKAVHTMALAQQQYSSSNSVIQSAAPSSTVAVDNNNMTAPYRTAVTTILPKLTLQTNPTQQRVVARPLESPSNDNESGKEGREEANKNMEQLEVRRTRRREEEERVNIATVVSSSSSHSNLAAKLQAAAFSTFSTEMVQPHAVKPASLQTAVSTSFPHNFALPSTAALASSPVASSASFALQRLNLSALPTSPLTVGAMSNQLLAGLPAAAAITPTGIGTPTGLLSPILYGSNPFLTLLGGSSPSLPTVTAAAASSQAAAVGVLATAASLNQAAAGASDINIQLIKQLQEKISAHLQTVPSNPKGADVGGILTTGRMPPQQALSCTAFDQELSKRERLLESLLMSKSPIYCIASPPEVLFSDALPNEHTIECIDTQKKISRSRDSRIMEDRYSEDEQVNAGYSGSDSDRKETSIERRTAQSSSASASQSLRTTEAKLSTSLINASGSSISNNTHLLPSPSIASTQPSLFKPTAAIPIPPQVASANVTRPLLSGLSLAATPSLSLATTPQVQQAGLPLLSYAAHPPTTAAALAQLPSPLKGYYLMLNPLATAATGVTATGGATAVQPIMIAAAPGNSGAVGPTVCGGTGTIVQVPALTPAAGLTLPPLASSSSSPMYCYLPTPVDGTYNLTAAAAVNSALTAQAVGPLAMATTAGDGSVQVKDDKLEGKLRNHGESTSLQTGRAKKRIKSDLTNLTDSTTKRIKLDTERVRVDSEDEAGGVQCTTASESDDEGADKVLVHGGDNCKPSGNAYKGHLQLWEFLLDLLLTPNHGSIIQWTGNEYEFNIVNPEAVVGLWGAHKNKPQMTYEKMSRSLRYYYSQGIMDKVPGKRYTFKFAFDIQKYIIDKKTNLFTLTS